MNNWGKEKTDPSAKISPIVWKKYFENLLNDENVKNNDELKSHKFDSFDPALDGHITTEELKRGLKQLKRGKTPGPDGILTEYLTDFAEVSENTILEIIRTIFTNYVYPSKWGVNFLKPIYKKDNNTVPDNYRGLAIGSTIAKLFRFILLNRINKYIEERNIISPNQIGFLIIYTFCKQLWKKLLKSVKTKNCL